MIDVIELFSRFGIEIVVIILILTVGSGTLAIGWSVVMRLADRSMQHHRPRIGAWLEERRTRPAPEWESAVAGLSPVERDVLADVLEDYLRRPTTPDPSGLSELAAALDVEPEFDGTAPRRRSERMKALNWALLLDADVEPAAIEAYVSDHRNEREAAARVLLGSTIPGASRHATELLLRDGPLSVFGLDTLYRHNRSDPSSLLTLGAERYRTLDSTLLAQALSVARQCVSTSDEPVDWIVDCLSHESPDVRVATAEMLISRRSRGTRTVTGERVTRSDEPDGSRGPPARGSPGTKQIWNIQTAGVAEGNED